LPGGGNELPPAFESWCLFVAFLRAGLPPASLNAAAKSWLPAREVAEDAGSDALDWTGPLEGCACKTGGTAFIPPEIASDVPNPSGSYAGQAPISDTYRTT
jgi:hypothetical protein